VQARSWDRRHLRGADGQGQPYKPGKTLSESLRILGNFKQNGHIDPDLFDIFVRKKVYLRYAEKFLDPDQIDAVDESKIPGFVP